MWSGVAVARRSQKRQITPVAEQRRQQRAGDLQQSRVMSRELSALIDMPRIDLPAGVAHVQVTERDMQDAATLDGLPADRVLELARKFLRDGRTLMRRSAARGAMKAAKASRERSLAHDHLVNAGILCGAVELLRAEMLVKADRLARIRERCQEQAAAEVGAYAVRVENWTRDLAGERRLTRG